MSESVVPRRLARAAGALLALALAGCAGSRSFTIPPASPAIREPARQVPAALGVYYPPETSGRVAKQVIGGAEGSAEYSLPIGDGLVDTYTAFLPRLFQRVERVSSPAPPPGSSLDGVLEISLGSVALSLPSAFETRPCQVSLEESFTLRDHAGAVVATWKATGNGTDPRGAIVQCGGKAASLALEDAAQDFVRGFASDPAAHAWMVARGGKPLPGEPDEVRHTLAHESESIEGETLLRTFGVYGGGGYFWPGATESHLSSPQGGFALVLGVTWRPLPFLGVNFEAENLSSSYGTDNAVPPAGTVALGDRFNLNQTLFAPSVRFSWPVSILEPWVALGPVLDFGYLSWVGSGTSGYVTTSSESRFVVGAQVGGGVDVVVTPSVELGARWQWLWTYADFGSLSNGSTFIGGQSVMVTGGYFWP